MAVTRATVLGRLAEKLGGYSGTITSGTATTAVLGGLIAVSDDDSSLDGWNMIMPDAANTTDQERVIVQWTASSGTALWSTARTDTNYTSETYLLLPARSYTLAELRSAINEALRVVRYSTRTVVPTAAYMRSYGLAGLTWLRNDKDVDQVLFRASPNLLDNENFSQWPSGSTAAPGACTLSGSGGTIARSTALSSYGPYAAQVTRVGTDTLLSQSVPYQVAKQLIDNLATVSLKVRCTATAATRVRVGIYNGTTATYSSYHSGDSEPEDLTVSVTLTAAASEVTCYLSVDTGNTMGSFDAAFLVADSSVPDTLTNGGSSGYIEQQILYQKQNAGGVPFVTLEVAKARGGQLLIDSRRPYWALSLDADSTDCPEDTLLHGAMYFLTSRKRPGEDRTRLDVLAKEHGLAFRELGRGLIDIPPPPAVTRYAVTGA